MKNTFILLTIMILFTTVSHAQEEEAAPGRFPLFRFFHMYMEYGSGELNKDFGDRVLENLDVKMTYSQNISAVPWLSFGFIGQVTWEPYGRRDSGNLTKLVTPSKMNLTGTMGFVNNIFTLGVSSEGVFTGTVYYNKVLPPTPGLYSHDLTVLFAPSFYLPGNQYDASDNLTLGWFDKLEWRIAYRMKFNQYVGLRPEFLFMFAGTDLVAGKSADQAFMFRFNPRLQFYVDQFSFFIEPRFFWMGSPYYRNATGAKDGFLWEIKVGFDIAHFVFRD